MRTYLLQRTQFLPRPVQEIFEFFSRPENLQRITPAWLDFRILETPAQLAAGSLIRYRLHWYGIPLRWTTEIAEWAPPHRFVDRAVASPYPLWNHEHRFSPADGGTTMVDEVTYALPLGPLGRIAHRLLVRRDLERLFDFRAQTMRGLFPDGPGAGH
jgi:ligand-binding SRPBCC domain-containing protein